MEDGKIRWGIVSTADIGLKKVIPGIQRSKTGIAFAIGSRDKARADAAARALGIERAYGSYEDLLADPDVDAVYIPLPNHLHVPLTRQAVEAGKHVLCEKPLALNAEEAAQLRDLPKDRLVAENFMVRAHPQWMMAREIIRSGELGELKAIQAFFSYFNDDPGNIRNMADIGGGALYDIGCYTMLAGRYFFEAEPQRVVSLIDKDPQFGTDRMSSALLDFGAGRHLTFTVSTQLTPYQRVQLVGTKKRLEIVIPVNAPQGEAVSLRVDDGSVLGDAVMQTQIISPCDQYAELVDVFGKAVAGEAPLPYGLEDAIQNMKVLDALFASAVDGGWVSLS
ncbi:Gfo/Idh/MocA family protein [Roseibium salinum]|uniref:Gfo/Idh/MocA family oxidoreductase n=1 Tax=Roseibium salinum TaxID=1604349 RepID=A0ABT3R7F0_9HYPH|nr:Gfo/Idh/MocA family oxidoreductase [Roseibium sp. DSM 29163]MCX2725178.1 Gfo/Idh/MocA family oxidoreductase [Roseibium sp. DSM 29163]